MMYISLLLLSVSTVVVNYGHAAPLAEAESRFSNEYPPYEEQNLTWLANLETSAPGAFQGDILLKRDDESRKFTRVEEKIWPAGEDGNIIVPYTFGDFSINQTEVKRAIKIWTDNTCIQFEEVSPDFNGSHLIFVDSNSCSSFIGMTEPDGQEVRLHPACLQTIYSAVHEIGHALGFYHEHSRLDRNLYIKILTENIDRRAVQNFDRASTNNYGIPYDYASLMHYDNRAFTVTGHPTIMSPDPFSMPVMGNRESFSFWDVKLANVVYKCIDRWQETCGVSDDHCLNGGYVDQTCECICPDGTTGNQCENVEMTYDEAMVKKITPLSETIYTPGTISSPGYPTPLQEKTAFMKIFIAPLKHRIQIVFDDFDVWSRQGQACDFAYVSMYRSLDMSQLITACGNEMPLGLRFMSLENTFLLEYYNFEFAQHGATNRRRGFSANVTYIPWDDTTLYPSRERGGCSLLETNTTGEYLFRSPNYPENYGFLASCSVDISTKVPTYLKITALDIEIGFLDSVGAEFELYDFRSYKVRRDGWGKIVPTSHVSLEFFSAPFSWGKFELKIEVLSTSNCHRIMELAEGETGVLTLPSTYDSKTICEWWLEAPEGKRIQLEMDDFYIGSDTFYLLCTDDYLTVNLDGDKRYGGTSEEYCGSERSDLVRSSRNKMTILFNGLKGGSNDFKGRYSVV